MPVVSDFTVIQGDGRVTLGDSGLTLWEATFGTGGRAANEMAFLIFNVRGLTDTDVDVVVKVNNVDVGTIRRYGGNNENSGHWYTQMITVDGSTLISGNNELQIEAVGWPGAEAGNMFDDFDLKDVICFFHQEV